MALQIVHRISEDLDFNIFGQKLPVRTINALLDDLATANYLDSAACDWTPEEIDFVDWVFNASPVLMERTEMITLHEGMTYERNAEKRAPYAQRSLDFIDRSTDTLSKKMVRKVRNRWGEETWP